MQALAFGRWKPPAALLVLALLLGGCGRADQAAQQPSGAPLAPLPTTPEAATATPGIRPTPLIFRPTPDNFQRAATAIAETIQTEGELFHQTADARETATAAWAQTPEPTILPPAGGDRLRELWPASPQAASAPSRLYLRSVGGHRKPDTFWEVRLPGMEIRRLPAVEQESVDDAALVSPDGRFLAYVTGTPRRDLRLLDLASDVDLGIDVAVIDGSNRCRRQIAWSPDGHTLAALAILPQGSDWLDHLVLFDPQTSPAPQPLLRLSGSLELLGWLDDERLLLVHWSRKVVEPARLLSVDRQGNQTLLRTLEPGVPRCSSLSPDGRDLIYHQNERTRRVLLTTGEEQPFSLYPNQFFWLGDGRTLLVSPFDQGRKVSLHPLDQPEQEHSLVLSPPYQQTYHFQITGVSPDGTLLVACEGLVGDNPRIRSDNARTWLYDIAQDRWSHIRDNASRTCDLVLGWSTTGAAP